MGFLNQAELQNYAASGQPEQIRKAARQPFKYSWAEQAYLLYLADQMEQESPIGKQEDIFVRLSQLPDFISECLDYARRAVQAEVGESDQSLMRLTRAANVLRNLAWFSGPHLEK